MFAFLKHFPCSSRHIQLIASNCLNTAKVLWTQCSASNGTSSDPLSDIAFIRNDINTLDTLLVKSWLLCFHIIGRWRTRSDTACYPGYCTRGIATDNSAQHINTTHTCEYVVFISWSVFCYLRVFQWKLFFSWVSSSTAVHKLFRASLLSTVVPEDVRSR